MPEISLNIEKTEYKVVEAPPQDELLSPKERKEIIMEHKKHIRRERYENSTEPLKLELFRKLEDEKLASPLTYGNNGNGKSSETRSETLIWDIQALNKVPLNDKEKKRLIQFVKPKKRITYEEIENILSTSPNFLVASMTILQNNYDWATTDLRTLTYKRQDNKDPSSLWDPSHLFSTEEERIFFGGRTLLVELNKALEKQGRKEEHNYVKELIRKVDDVIIRFNKGLVGDEVQKRRGLAPEGDLEGEGNLGLLKVLKKFDIDMNYRFSTYATWWIESYISRYCDENRSEIKSPVYISQALDRVLKIKEDIEKEEEIEISIEEVIEYCEDTGIELQADPENLINAYYQRDLISLDEEFENSNEDDASSILDFIPDQSPGVEEILISGEKDKTIKQIKELANLTAREERVIDKRTGLIPNEEDNERDWYTLNEIGEKEGLTGERIRQIEARAKEKLRRVASQVYS
jgi:RNA polymerase primary sigma factor